MEVPLSDTVASARSDSGQSRASAVAAGDAGGGAVGPLRTRPTERATSATIATTATPPMIQTVRLLCFRRTGVRGLRAEVSGLAAGGRSEAAQWGQSLVPFGTSSPQYGHGSELGAWGWATVRWAAGCWPAVVSAAGPKSCGTTKTPEHCLHFTFLPRKDNDTWTLALQSGQREPKLSMTPPFPLTA